MNFRLKRIVFSTILFAASAVHTSSYAQATREEIFDNIAVTGGVYYAYPAPGVQTKAPKGYEPFYISHFGRHGSRWLISDEEYIRVMEVFEKAHQAGKLTPLGEDVRKRLAIVWADAEGRGGDLSQWAWISSAVLPNVCIRHFPKSLKVRRRCRHVLHS